MPEYEIIYKVIELILAVRKVPGFPLPSYNDRSKQVAWATGLLEFLKANGYLPQQIVDSVSKTEFTFKGGPGHNEFYFVVIAAQMELVQARNEAKLNAAAEE